MSASPFTCKCVKADNAIQNPKRASKDLNIQTWAKLRQSTGTIHLLNLLSGGWTFVWNPPICMLNDHLAESVYACGICDLFACLYFDTELCLLPSF